MTRTAPPPEAAREFVKVDRTLTYRLHLLHKLSDQVSQRLYPLEVGLSLSDARCLAAVGSFEPLSVNRLAQLANLNKAQASRAAQSLAEQGLVIKADHPADGRGVELTLTPAGRKVWRKAMDFIERRNAAIFGCLGERDQQTLSKLLDRLLAHANAGANDTAPDA
ncbi:MAG TPA: MarR family winged helix-turn-helix transcriptional regulator [Ramlibacter sp.]|nr:MarR family winged helix-turn-helix transcriptional regulator [Ramlibacter sp.]